MSTMYLLDIFGADVLTFNVDMILSASPRGEANASSQRHTVIKLGQLASVQSCLVAQSSSHVHCCWMALDAITAAATSSMATCASFEYTVECETMERRGSAETLAETWPLRRQRPGEPEHPLLAGFVTSAR